jgi:hypothetical protein
MSLTRKLNLCDGSEAQEGDRVLQKGDRFRPETEGLQDNYVERTDASRIEGVC